MDPRSRYSDSRRSFLRLRFRANAWGLGVLSLQHEQMRPELGAAASVLLQLPEEHPVAEHDPADRIGRARAVAQQVVERWVARLLLIAAKGNQQVGEGLARKVELADRLGEGYEDRMTWRIARKGGL